MGKTSMKEDEVNYWFKQIALSLKWREPYEKQWRHNIELLKGQVYDEVKDEDRICINKVYPYIRVVIPAVYSRNPDVLVEPRKRSQANDELRRKRAQVMQVLLRYYLKELDIKSEVKLCILDGILCGHAWVKTGYETQFTKEDKVKAEDNKNAVEKLMDALGMSTQEEEEEDTYTYNEKVTSESAWVLRESPFDIIVPALSRRPEELGWITGRSICPYEEVMENKEYFTKGLKPSANANQLLAALRSNGEYTKTSYGDDLKYVIKYEIWNEEDKNVITLADGFMTPLSVKDSGYTFLDSKYHPYRSLRFNELIDEFYPQTDLEPANAQFEELDETRTQMNNHRKRFNRRYLSRPNALDPQAKADLIAGADGTIVEVSTHADDRTLDDIVHPITDATLPPEVYAVEARIKDDIDDILGTNSYASQAGSSARSATEASIMASEARFRVEERIDQIGDFVEDILRNLAQISMYYMDKKQVSDIVGDDAKYWVQYDSRREIQREYDFGVVYGSSAPINRAVDREQFMKFYVMVKDDPYFDQAKLRLELSRKFDLENPEGWLVPQIAQEIDKQRMIAAKAGLLLPLPQGAENQSGTPGAPGRVPDLSKSAGGNLNDSGELGGMPEIPGGAGGTALAPRAY